jgi:hypothetical protein
LWGRSGKFTADVSAGEEENMEKEEPDFRHKTPDVEFIHLSRVADPDRFNADPDPAF